LKGQTLISVISACYNQGKFIGDMLESVLQQTLQDFEVIIVNDGSTDDTSEILRKIKNDKVRVFHTANNGPAAARNLAIENANADIIMNLDADDMISPVLLQRAYNVFSSEPNVGIVYCDAECFGAKTGKFEIGEYTLENMLCDNRINSQAFFRKEDWSYVGGYSGELIYNLEDWDFYLSIIELGRSVHRIPEQLAYYRTYNNPLKSRSGRMKKDRMKTL
jgi:glycosyltransferase involved in cell wall biosynthesis